MNASPDTFPLQPGISRRSVLGITVAGAAGLLTAACGSSSGATKTAGGSSSTPGAAGSSASSGGSSSLVATADVPVGGGVFVQNGKVIAKPSSQEKLTAVVTQPTAGEFKAFSTTCTHVGCTVTSIKDGIIICPCHQSAYKITDGSTTVNPETGKKGPAPSPLPSIAVKVDGANVVKA
jgi:Rieske Fe-S protein